MARVTTQSALDRVVAILAALACIVFAMGLVDTPVRPVATSPEVALPDGTPRDAELSAFAEDSAGRPVKDVTFTAFWKQGDEYYWVGKRHSNAEGSVHFGALPRGEVWLVADKDGFARNSAQLVLAGEPREARVRLGPGHRLTLSVEGEAGSPLEDATVVVEDADPLPHGALSGADGVARIERLSPPPWNVRVSARGFETKRMEVSTDTSVTLRRLGVLTVHVVDPGGESVGGASVVISGARLWPARKTTTNADGRAKITGLLAGSYDLRAFKGTSVSPTLHGFNLANGGVDELTLNLAPGRLVRAFVVDAEGAPARPVADADVVLVEGGLSSFPLRGRTDEQGRVQLGPILAGPAMLAARADGFVTRSGVQVPLDSSEEVTIGLIRGGTVIGSVVDAAGYPVAGASIEVVGSDLFGLPIVESPLLMNFSRAHFAWSLSGPVSLIPAGHLGVMPGPVPPIPGLGAALSGAPSALLSDVDPAELEPWVTRATGEFTAYPVTPGRVRALVRHPEFVETLSEVVTLAPGGSAEVRIELFRGGVLAGHVKDTRDFPIAGASVELQALRGTFERVTLTQADGSFAFAAVPKQVVISVAREGEPSRIVLREHLEVTEGERTEIELSLPEPRPDVQIVVVDATDAPVSMAQVSVASLDPHVPRRETLFTDQNGQVQVTDLGGLPLEVSVEALGAAPRRVQLQTAGEAVRIQLLPGVTLNGSVTAVRGRFPVASAQVFLLFGGERRLAVTDQQGQYRFEHVPLGSAQITVEHPEHARVTKNVLVRDTGRADRPLELEPIDLVEPGSVAGTVVDARGEPVRAARVTAGFAPAYLPAGALPAGLVTTDASGSFLLEGLPPGVVELSAYAPSHGRGSVNDVSVVSGAVTSDVVLRLNQPAEEEAPVGRGNLAVTLGERGSAASLEVVLASVAEASEAERGGLLPGDRVVAVEGQRPSDMLEARLLLAGPVGSHVVLEIARAGARHLLTVVREEVRR